MFWFDSLGEKEAETACAAYVGGPRAGLAARAGSPVSPGSWR